MHFDVGIPLVILEADVVLGSVLFDERVFQQQRFQLRLGGNDFDVGDFAAQALGFDGIHIFVEIRAHAIAQVDRLTHINNCAVFIFMQINASSGGQLFQDFLYVLRWCVRHEPIIAHLSDVNRQKPATIGQIASKSTQF